MFITFEGCDGSGKTTIIKQIAKLLKKNGHEMILTHEPGGTSISEKIRKIILDKKNTKMDKRTETLLYAASRRQHLIEKIWPALKKKKIVLCDRFVDSSLAYQGGARHIDIKEILNINLFATENYWPDLTFLFDIDPKISLQRIQLAKQKHLRKIDRLDNEKINFHLAVRKKYLELAKQYASRYIIINAKQKNDKIVKIVYQKINQYLKNEQNK